MPVEGHQREAKVCLNNHDTSVISTLPWQHWYTIDYHNTFAAVFIQLILILCVCLVVVVFCCAHSHETGFFHNVIVCMLFISVNIVIVVYFTVVLKCTILYYLSSICTTQWQWYIGRDFWPHHCYGITTAMASQLQYKSSYIHNKFL